MTDPDALQRFAADGAHDAFAHLVGKHVHFVYTAAFRQLRDTTLADQATQATFLLLARYAKSLRPDTPLVPWLFNTSHHVCRTLLNRSTNFATDSAAGRAPPPGHHAPNDWANLSPQIDDALASLPTAARDAVLLKYVACVPLRDVAEALKLDDAATGQQINRGVARLRKYFEAKSLFIPAEALVASLQAHAIREAPPTVAMNAVTAALAPPGQSGAIEFLVDDVARKLRRIRLTRIALASVVVLFLGLVTFQLISTIRHARAVAASQLATAPQPAPQPSPTPAVAPPSMDRPLPTPKPVKPVDPELAARFLAAIRASNYTAVENYANVDDNVVNVTDPKTKETAVQIAANLVSWQRRESAKIAQFLIDNGALTDLHTAARAGHAQYVALTLAINLRLLNAQDAQGLTPLQRAALIPGSSPECEAVVDLLITVGAKVDLCTACTFGRLDDVKTALAADPKQINAPVLGGTPLNWAARPRRHEEDPLAIANLLLAAGADPAARDTLEDGMSPLHHAAEWGAPVALADLLLQKKVDVNVLDDFGWTPLDYATDRNHKELIAFLADKGGRLTTARFPNQPSKTLRFFAAVKDNDARLVKILLNDTPELANTRGVTGETPLHWAAAQGNIPIIDLLLGEEAQINAQETNRFGGTPLHWAVRHDQLAAAQHLMEKGADPKAVNNRNGQTLLHTAAQHTYDPPLIDLLVSLGIDKSAKDRFGKTARDYADQSNHQNIAGKL